ncbi:hypothetical protein AB0O01_29600 [Streptomyces sp. NPDC093252]|uniref:hypothetical protein n=1 Tax=Streptomyces sp. NPDC093252 TaxID=3154980 RepID=UPI00344AE1A9
MAEQTSHQPHSPSAELTPGLPFHPRLGDLAHDLAKGGAIGVVVALPSSTSASYHLRPPGGGADWRARNDGSTLRPVPVPVTHVTPMQRDAVYDHRAQQAAVPVTVHYEHGGTCETVLVLTPGQVELHCIQLGRLIEARESAREHER